MLNQAQATLLVRARLVAACFLFAEMLAGIPHDMMLTGEVPAYAPQMINVSRKQAESLPNPHHSDAVGSNGCGERSIHGPVSSLTQAVKLGAKPRGGPALGPCNVLC